MSTANTNWLAFKTLDTTLPLKATRCYSHEEAQGPSGSPGARRWLLLITWGVALGVFAAGCATHIAPYRPKHRRFDPGEYASSSKRSPGSLFTQGDPGLVEDYVATRVGDILIIRIDERDSGSQDASAALARKDETKYAVPSAFGLMAKLKTKFPNLDPTALFGSTGQTKFSGSGATSRTGKLNATLPVRVRQVMPNGDLYIEGSKVVMVGHEEHHIYVSGIVNALDIAADNSVLSSRIADAEIEYTGRGDISDQQRQGWLTRTMGKVWPF